MLIVPLWQVVIKLTCPFLILMTMRRGDIVPDSENEEETDPVQQALK